MLMESRAPPPHADRPEIACGAIHIKCTAYVDGSINRNSVTPIRPHRHPRLIRNCRSISGPARALRAVQARRESGRVRLVDPTRCERDYPADEIDFMRAIQGIKEQWPDVSDLERGAQGGARNGLPNTRRHTGH